MPTNEEIAQQQELLQTHRRTLATYIHQHAIHTSASSDTGARSTYRSILIGQGWGSLPEYGFRCYHRVGSYGDWEEEVLGTEPTIQAGQRFLTEYRNYSRTAFRSASTVTVGRFNSQLEREVYS
jgi:hypothetical protein